MPVISGGPEKRAASKEGSVIIGRPWTNLSKSEELLPALDDELERIIAR